MTGLTAFLIRWQGLAAVVASLAVCASAQEATPPERGSAPGPAVAVQPADGLEVRLSLDPPDDAALSSWKDARPLTLLLDVTNIGPKAVRLPPLDYTMVELRTKEGAPVSVRWSKVPGADLIKMELGSALHVRVEPGQRGGLTLNARVLKDGRIEMFPWVLARPLAPGSYELRVVYAGQTARTDGITIRDLWTGKIVSNWAQFSVGQPRAIRKDHDMALSLDVQPRQWPFPPPAGQPPFEFTVTIAIRNTGSRPLRLDLAQLDFLLRDLTWPEVAAYATAGGLPFRLRGALPSARTPGQLPRIEPGATHTVEVRGRFSEKNGLELGCGEPGKQEISAAWWTGGSLSPVSLNPGSPATRQKRTCEFRFSYENGGRIRAVDGIETLIEDLWLGEGVQSKTVRIVVGGGGARRPQ